MNELQLAMPALMSGFWVTLKVLILAIIGGLAIGTVLALMRLSGKKWLSVPAALYVNYFRSVPLLLVLLWFYFAVPMMYNVITGKFFTLDTAFTSCVVAFMVFEAAYFSEIVRAGIQSIGQGQVSASYALGMTYKQSMQLIILPQAFRKMLPLVLHGLLISHASYALGMTYKQSMQLIILPQAFRKMLPLVLQQCIILFQDTTLVFAIGLVDFFRAAYVRGDLMGLLTPYILGAGAVYFVISLTASIGVNALKKRLRF